MKYLQGIDNESSVPKTPLGGDPTGCPFQEIRGACTEVLGCVISWVQMAIVNNMKRIGFPHCSVYLLADPLSTP